MYSELDCKRCFWHDVRPVLTISTWVFSLLVLSYEELTVEPGVCDIEQLSTLLSTTNHKSVTFTLHQSFPWSLISFVIIIVIINIIINIIIIIITIIIIINIIIIYILIPGFWDLW